MLRDGPIKLDICFYGAFLDQLRDEKLDISRKMSVFGVLVVVLLTGAFDALGCTVPVFRYALERWQADPYPVEIVHNGALGDEAKSALEKLKLHADREDVPANIFVRVIDGANT